MNYCKSKTPLRHQQPGSSPLPLSFLFELQMVLCFRQVGSAKEIISGKDSEMAFKLVAKWIS